MTQSSLVFIPDLNKVQQIPRTLAISLTYNIRLCVQSCTYNGQTLYSTQKSLPKAHRKYARVLFRCALAHQAIGGSNAGAFATFYLLYGHLQVSHSWAIAHNQA
ncbi:hypothetical protein DP114_24065 [Brasilonema sennae CENA114]|uniref:Uncharacterized protein n=1 Tax=Brasilonema sennae CENA114 TaxID=415709 RepID=A0A856MJ20_9CYAN|nr:hypothetical protein DP114_24065 [Brasilonema sennae CENA114]